MSALVRCDGCPRILEPDEVYLTVARSDSGDGLSLPSSPYHYCLPCGVLAHLVLRRAEEERRPIPYYQHLLRAPDARGGRGFVGNSTLTLGAALQRAEREPLRVLDLEALWADVRATAREVAQTLGMVEPVASDSDLDQDGARGQLSWIRGAAREAGAQLPGLAAPGAGGVEPAAAVTENDRAEL